jgi:hypothetical protein
MLVACWWHLDLHMPAWTYLRTRVLLHGANHTTKYHKARHFVT